AKNLKVDGKQRVLAAILTGTFDTAFPDGPPVPDNGDGDVDLDQIQLRAERHQSRSIRPTSVLVIGDADFMADPFSVQKVNLFGQTMVKAINDNLNFVLNGIEFISGSQDLISIRSRGTFSRPFTRVLALQRKAQEEYREQENQLSTRLEEVRKRLNELEGGENRVAGQQVILTPEILEEVKRFREEELATRQALREVRRVLRQDIESLGTVLLTINLLAVPLVVAAFGFIGFYRRNKKSGGRV
ncbi:MAG: ABC transporter, partial [SAR324 cluster bacterium]|nr:ABC transporter [SAR324 cluster bacterium]